jgi:hypothetical protein
MRRPSQLWREVSKLLREAANFLIVWCLTWTSAGFSMLSLAIEKLPTTCISSTPRYYS